MRTNVAIASLGLIGLLAACSNAQQSQVDDVALNGAVRAQLAAVDPDAVTAVRVAVANGDVTLAGSAHSASERDSYVAAARSVQGVTSVTDRLVLNSRLQGPKEQAGDAALAVRVSAAIAAQSGVNAFSVTPSVRDGVVTLKGSVPSRDLERVIIETVSKVDGVKHVNNDIRTK